MKKLIFTVIISFFLISRVNAQVTVTLPDLVYSSPIGTIIDIPVSCGSLTGLNVIAYQFKITFDNGVLVPESPYYSTAGTLSSTNGWTVMANAGVANQVSIGAFGSGALSGSGTLVKLIFKIASANGSTPLGLNSFYFNAGNPQVTTANGSFTNQDCSNFQTFVIPAGWSGISSFLVPSDPNMVNTFFPIENKLLMINNFTNRYSPIYGILPILPWDSNSGYFIKLSEPVIFQICGQPIPNKTLNLVTGWNLVPVLSDGVYFCEEVMSGLNFEIVKAAVGTDVYWPSEDIQTLYFFEAGKAYLIKMNSPGSITFP